MVYLWDGEFAAWRPIFTIFEIAVIRRRTTDSTPGEMPNRIVTSTLLALTAVAVLAPAVEAIAGFTEVSPSTLKYEGVRYWRKKANEAELGSVGQKMTPMAGKNYFQKMQDAPAGIYKVSVGEVTTLTTQQASEWGVTATYSNMAGGVSGSGAYQGTLTAYKMNIDLGNTNGDLRYETNRHNGHLSAFKEQGNGARLISAVWIAVRGAENKQECYSGDLTVTNGVASVTTSASGCSNSTWTINPGAVIAYEMVKAESWNNEEITQRPTCPASHPTYESRNSTVTPKDRCKKTTYDNVATQCKLLITDDKDNWYVQARDGRDTCKSRKGKPDKDVECSAGGYQYQSQAGRDTCRKAEYTYVDPSCPAGYDYDSKSTSNNGVDVCELKGIANLKPDSHDGF